VTPEDRKAHGRAWAKTERLRRRNAGLCLRCGKSRPEPGLRNCPQCRQVVMNAYYDKHRTKRIAAHKIAHQRLKLATFQAYSDLAPFCQCCQETAMEFLTIDHINGSDMRNAERTNGTHRDSGNALYRRLKREGWPAGYRVLCLNCNFAIGHFSGCPHQKRQ